MVLRCPFGTDTDPPSPPMNAVKKIARVLPPKPRKSTPAGRKDTKTKEIHAERRAALPQPLLAKALSRSAAAERCYCLLLPLPNPRKMYACMYVSMYVCIYVCMYACACVRVRGCVRVHGGVRVRVRACVRARAWLCSCAYCSRLLLTMPCRLLAGSRLLQASSRAI